MGLKKLWLNEGRGFGVTAAGGAGWRLAESIVDSKPTIDMIGVDPRRFGPCATQGYVKVKNEEAFATSSRHTIRMKNGRPPARSRSRRATAA